MAPMRPNAHIAAWKASSPCGFGFRPSSASGAAFQAASLSSAAEIIIPSSVMPFSSCALALPSAATVDLACLAFSRSARSLAATATGSDMSILPRASAMSCRSFEPAGLRVTIGEAAFGFFAFLKCTFFASTTRRPWASFTVT